jgi:hypothetical protein
VFTKLSNGPMRVIPHSEVFFVYWRIFLPLYYGASLVTFITIFLVAEMTTGYSDFPMSDKSSEVVADEWAVVTKYLLL